VFDSRLQIYERSPSWTRSTFWNQTSIYFLPFLLCVRICMHIIHLAALAARAAAAHARAVDRARARAAAEKISLPIVMQYAHFLEQLPATIDSLTTSAGSETEVHLPLKLDLLPAMLQYLLSTGQLSREHVAYQSLERLCLLALNKDDMMPTNHLSSATRTTRHSCLAYRPPLASSRPRRLQTRVLTASMASRPC
jgi:hypothetical protein